MAKLVTTFLCS